MQASTSAPYQFAQMATLSYGSTLMKMKALKKMDGTKLLRKDNRRRRIKYVSEYQDRHGAWRARYRHRGIDHTFKSPVGTQEFWDEYNLLQADQNPIGASRSQPGTISGLISRYYRTTEFMDLADSSKRTYRTSLEYFRKGYGNQLVRGLQRRHIQSIIAEKAGTPTAANKLLKCIHLIMMLAIELEIRTDDPCAGVKKYKIKSDGYYTWSEDDITQFENYHKVGTKSRLAFALMLYLAQRRSDVVGLGWQHVKDGVITLRQIKTNTPLALPIHPDLAAVLQKSSKKNMSFLMTKFGKTYSADGIGNAMRKWCDDASLPQCSSLGLRKAASRRMAEAGATEKQIMSMTGHTTSAEVTRYTKAANQQQIAADNVLKLSNPAKRLDK